MNTEKMWDRLVQHQPLADQHGYGPEWARMCAERTQESMAAARDAALAAEQAARWAVWSTMWIDRVEGEWA